MMREGRHSAAIGECSSAIERLDLPVLARPPKMAVFARNIALASPLVTNTHNYAIQFQRAGWNTVWVPKPLTPLKGGKRATVKFEKYGIRERELILLFNYGGRTINSYKFLWDIFPFFLLSPSRRAMSAMGLLSPDLFFAGSLETASLYKLFRPRTLVYNAHDAFSCYPGVSRSIKAIEAEVLMQADVTVTTAEMTRELLIERYGVLPERVLNLGHGVDNSRYERVVEPERLQTIGRPRVVCLGTLDMQDIELTVSTVRSLPDASFLFIGPGGDRLRERLRTSGAGNTHFLGPISQEQLPHYLAFCDVGLIGYDLRLRDTRLYGTNPMKRYDYAAAGLQVVSVDLLEYQKTPSPMYRARSAEEYVESVRSAIYSPRYSKEEIRRFARANDWSVKYTNLIMHVEAIQTGGLRVMR